MLHNSQKDFLKRHIGPSDEDQNKMLKELNYKSLDDLIKSTVPEKIQLKDELNIGESNSEYEALRKLKAISKKNQIYSNFIGMGYYGTYTPYVILRNILENPGWYTSYTPYQPEVAQGRLEMLLNFQQMIVDFTGMDIANASLLDEGTAAAEAMGLSHRLNKKDSNLVFVSENCHPQTIDVIQTRAEPMGLKVLVGDEDKVLDHLKEDLVCGILQYPGTLGDIKDPSEAISKIHKKNGKAILACDLLALAKLKTPRELGADIAVGSSQRFGIPMGYGGPHAAFFATKDEYKRSMPGRIVGVSVDRHGNKAYRLSLQTREQHIRRDKATSNICTAQALLAIVSAAYAIYHGPDGIKTIAERVSQLAKNFADKLKQSGYEIYSDHFFDTVTIVTKDKTDQIYKNALDQKVNIRKVNSEMLAVSFDEKKNVYRVNQLLKIFNAAESIKKEDPTVSLPNLPKNLLRTSKYLEHPVFNSYHSETEMLRYLKKLEDKDIALNRTMIALGSCTMKLNATAEMIPISWRELAEPHPFVPIEQMEGYRDLFTDLKNWLRSITGFSGVSLQPNAGAQGEYAGLMVIRKYHLDRGEENRNICLMANEQKKGFGRRGTTWESPKNNVYISILSKNILPIENHFLNNAFITNMICSVIENICNVKTQIKWPNDILINKEKISNEIQKPIIKKEMSCEILIEKKDEKLEKFDVLEKENMGNFSDNNQNNPGSNNLKDKWDLILSKVGLPSTRMLLSQQAELESFDSEKITIALSPNWENMIKSRKVIIENTVKKIFGDQIILNFSTKQLNKSNPTNTPEITQNEVNNFQPIKKIESKTNPSTKISNEETYDDSSKNLANFFNGEIIDLDE